MNALQLFRAEVVMLASLKWQFSIVPISAIIILFES